MILTNIQISISSNFPIFIKIMKYIKSSQQLQQLLQTQKLLIIIFVDPNEFMPAKSLLNFLFSHPLTHYVGHLIFIWNLIDERIYQKYEVVAFPQTTLLRGQQAISSFIGYNRQKASEILERCCKQSGLGQPQKQITNRINRCSNNHQLIVTGQPKFGGYPGGCFKCNICGKLCHFDQQRPTLHCQQCSYDVCSMCCYEDIMI